MSDFAPEKVFQTFPFLKDASDEVKERFFASAFEVTLDRGTTIWNEGDQCVNIALILSGEARVYKIAENGREITLYRISQGESCILTASCLMSDTVFPAFATTETHLTALSVPADTFRAWVNEYPLWQRYVFSLLARRMSAIISVVEEVAFRRVDSRIAAYLLGGIRADVHKTHYEIASEVGTSREVVSRILKEFEKQNIVSLSRGVVNILKAQELRKIAFNGQPM